MSILEQYSELTRKTAQYPIGAELQYLTAGLAGEAGEVCGKISKIFRQDPHNPSDQDILKEIGDVYWMLDRLCNYFGATPEQVMRMNMEKLESRLKRGTIKGSGDER